MLKKHALPFLLLLLCLLLTACDEPPTPFGATVPPPSSCEDVRAALAEGLSLNEQTILSENQTLEFLEMNDGIFSDIAMSMDASYATPEAIVVVNAVGDDFIAQIKDTLAEYLQALRNENPGLWADAEYAKLDAAVLNASDVQVVLIIGKDADTTLDALAKVWR